MDVGSRELDESSASQRSEVMRRVTADGVFGSVIAANAARDVNRVRPIGPRRYQIILANLGNV